MITPPFLRPGDKVAIVAPAGKIRQDGLNDALAVFRRWGLRVSPGNHIESKQHEYMAGTDEERLFDLQQALDHRDVRAVFCARGGYGTTRILDRVDFSSFKESPKWVIGFSDITALHLHLLQLGIESIHGTMPLLFSKSDALESVESLRKILFGEEVEINAGPTSGNRTGLARGIVTGGNLALIADSIGTQSEPDTERKILVLEEVEEYKYKLDRMLRQLYRAGKLEVLAGMVVGHMTNILETSNGFGETVEEIIAYNVREFDFPVGFRFPIGHKNPNIAWRHGSTMELAVSQEGSMLRPV